MATRCFLVPTRVLDANGISIASVVFAGLAKWQTDCETDRPRYSGTLQAAILVADLCCIIHERYLPLNLVARNRCQGDAWRICVKNGMFGRVYVGAKKSHTGFISCFRRSATSSTRAGEFHLFSTFRFKITDAWSWCKTRYRISILLKDGELACDLTYCVQELL